MKKLIGLSFVVLFALALGATSANSQTPAGERTISNAPAAVQNTPKQTADVDRKAAEAGDAQAQFNLGFAYEYGEGVPQNSIEAVKWYRKSAEQGYARAQSNLGFAYEHGEGVQKDATEALKWHCKAAKSYRKSAEQGDADAQSNLGAAYEYGYGVGKNKTEAANWYRKAAEQGNAEAQKALAKCYTDGKGVPQDATEAAKWYRKSVESYCKSAEQGDAQAQLHLGFAYEKGEGVPQNYTEAAKWYRKAAEQGLSGAQWFLGQAYKEGQGVAQDYTEASKWYRKAAEQGDADAQLNLGDAYRIGKGVTKDYTEAAKWYRKSAEQGNEKSQFRLGDAYKHGEGVAQDYTEAMKWYHKAAEQGNAEAKTSLLRAAAEQGDAQAQLNLGQACEDGDGVARDDAEAAKWYRKAAEQGNADAQRSLGFAYKYSEGVTKNYVEAAKWYRKAAEQEDALAQCWLADLYEGGQGVPQDYVEAYKWYNLATALRYDGKAVDKRDSLAKQMTSEQVAEGQRRTSEFLAKRGLSKKGLALISAASVGDVGRVKALLAEGADVNAKDNDGRTPLHVAAMKDHDNVVALLLARDSSACPAEVLLTGKASVPAIVDGKQFGLVELPAGTKLKLNSVQGEHLKVVVNGSEQIIPTKATDLLSCVIKICQAKAEHEKKAADLQLQTEDATKKQQATAEMIAKAAEQRQNATLAINSRIKSKAISEWPDKYDMQVYEIKKQVEAYNTLQGMTSASGVPQSAFDRIKSKAISEWPDKYDMQVYELKKQVEAYRSLNRDSIAKQEQVAEEAPARTTGSQTPPPTSVSARHRSAIASFKGSGFQNTRPFTVSSPWEIVWDAHGINIMVYTADGKQVDVAGNDTGKGRSYQPKGGTFYLGIQGIGDWEVSVVPATE